MDTARADAPSIQTPTPSTDPNTVQNIIAELKKMIAHELDVRIEENDIDPAVPLLEGGLMLDSMVLFEFITRIEERFGIAFATQNLSSEVFADLTVLSQHIHAMMQDRERHDGAIQ
ncbi:phosphopantetheine-binding protein [Sorangium sp. So ce296]|uniref:acyl carrier protein n=1 Tax=Sorangium sp. So ce296 TaxID=3133296 RepID=UPI003F5EB7BB